jgi:glycosyltransferase involved in cell wall biosynthesis
MSGNCFFIGAPAGCGAVASHFAALGRELARRGNDVKIFSSAGDANGICNAKNPALLSWPSRRPTRIADALFLARLIRRHRPDCLLANFGAVNWMCLVGWLCRVRLRFAFYHTLRSQMELDGSDARQHLNGISSFRKRFVYKSATCIAGISEAALADARSAFGIPASKCRLWRYSMPDPSQRLQLRSAEERDETLVCAARLSPSKGQDILISALALLNDLAGSTTIDFLGGGPMLGKLKQMAASMGVSARCRFVGAVSHHEVLTRMSRAKATVVPSRHEAFGLVNIESMSVGTPVIASEADGIREIVREGVDGCLVPPGDPKALARKLAHVLQDHSFRERLGRNARRRFLEEYDEAVILRQQVDTLEQAVRSRVATE